MEVRGGYRGSTARVVELEESSQIGEARRLARRAAEESGLDILHCERAAIIATELASNVVRHARAGLFLVSAVREAGMVGIDLLALDRGPGIAHIGEALRDGFSTAGTAGTGLGAVKRQSHLFEVLSRPGGGTVVASRILAAEASVPLSGLQLGAVCRAVHGEELSGDAWALRHEPDTATVLLVDGLGHGPLAAAAAEAAVAAFLAGPLERSPVAAVERCHLALRGTRGAALAVAILDHGREELRYAGVGNIAARVVSPGRTQNLVSMSGIAGQNASRAREFVYPWAEEATLVISSDGLRTSWSSDDYGAVWHRHPALAAALLLHDQARGRDDATVVVVRRAGP